MISRSYCTFRCDEITDIFSESQPSNTPQWVFLIRPSICVVEDIDRGSLGLFWLHHLNIHKPRRIVSFLNGIEEILDVVIWLSACQLHGRVRIHRLDPAFWFEVPLDVDVTSILLGIIMSWKAKKEEEKTRVQTYSLVECVSVNAKSIDMSQRCGYTPCPKKMHQSVNALRVVQMKIPKHGVVGNISSGMSLVAPVHGWELDWITNEENGQVIEDEVLDAILGVKFGGPAANIANRIAGSLLPSNSRNSGEDFGLFPLFREKLGISQI